MREARDFVFHLWRQLAASSADVAVPLFGITSAWHTTHPKSNRSAAAAPRAHDVTDLWHTFTVPSARALVAWSIVPSEEVPFFLHQTTGHCLTQTRACNSFLCTSPIDLLLFSSCAHDMIFFASQAARIGQCRERNSPLLQGMQLVALKSV